MSSSSMRAVTGPVYLRSILPSGPISQVVGRPRGAPKSFGGSYTSMRAIGYATGRLARNARSSSSLVSS